MVTISMDSVVSLLGHKQSFTDRPEPKPPSFCLADMQHSGDFSDRKSILKEC
jgi:hypothetical protein